MLPPVCTVWYGLPVPDTDTEAAGAVLIHIRHRNLLRGPAGEGGSDGGGGTHLPYPYARQLAGLAGIGLGDDWLRKVCWDNPVALLGRAQRRRSAAARSAVTRSRGRAGVRWPLRPVMSSLATSALTTASSHACTTAS